jgi:hypothetical protein
MADHSHVVTPRNFADDLELDSIIDHEFERIENKRTKSNEQGLSGIQALMKSMC